MSYLNKQDSRNVKNIFFKNAEEVAPAIFIYENVIDNCEEIINFSLSTPEKWREPTISSENGMIVDTQIRKNRIMDIPPILSNDIMWFEVSQTIWSYGNNYGMFHNVPFSNMEFPQILHYSTENNFYKAHSDSISGLSRIFSAVLYLNTVEEGGETYFDKFDISVSPREGRLLLFPSNFAYTHEAKPPKSNDKFAIVTWFDQ